MVAGCTVPERLERKVSREGTSDCLTLSSSEWIWAIMDCSVGRWGAEEIGPGSGFVSPPMMASVLLAVIPYIETLNRESLKIRKT